MPAAPYLISAQLALIVTSAVMVKSKLKRETAAEAPNVPAITEKAPAPAAISLDGLLAKAKAMPAAEIERFALVERNGHASADISGGVEARPMGYRDGADESTKPRGFESDPPADTTSRHGDGNTADSAPPEFAPVPESSGYHIDADAATNFDLNSETVVFSGNVSLKCVDFHLRADRLVVVMQKGKQSAMKRLVANGKVDVHLTGVPEEEVYRGRAEEATYDPSKNIITFTGWPRINGHGREHIAAEPSTKMTLHTVKPKLETSGRAQTRILADEKNGMPALTLGQPSATRE